jgi:ankyrin repeat protein
MNRRDLIRHSLVGGAAVGFGTFPRLGQPDETPPATKAASKEVRRSVPTDSKLINAFVGAAHGDLAKVKEMLASEPPAQKRLGGLILAERELGPGDFETALGGASHMGRRDIALFLLDSGARIDAFCAAMLGHRDVVLALLKAVPSTAMTKGPHGYTLLYHAALSGDIDIAVGIKPLLPTNAKDFNQALVGAAAAGRLPMTRWLLENGVTDPNVKNGIGKTALTYAVQRNFAEIADELRKHGAR